MRAGYASDAIIKFVIDHGERRDDGQFTHLNDRKMTDSHRVMLERWSKLDTIPLDKVDRFLMKYGLMTADLENWAESHWGYPFREPAAA